MTEKERLINTLVNLRTTNVFRIAKNELNTYSVEKLRALVRTYYPVIVKKYSKKFY